MRLTDTIFETNIIGNDFESIVFSLKNFKKFLKIMIIKRKNYMFALKFTSAQHSWYAHMEFPHILHYSGM